MEQSHLWAGLDIGHYHTSVCVIDDQGQVLHEVRCESRVEAVEKELSSQPIERYGVIGTEAGPGLHLVRGLRTAGYPVEVFEAVQASKFLAIKRRKSDPTDARGLADLARLGAGVVNGVRVKDLGAQNLRSQLVIRQHLVRQRVRLETIIAALVRLHGGVIRKKTTRKRLMTSVEAQAALLEQAGVNVGRDVRPLLVILCDLDSYLADLDRRLEEEAHSDPTCSLLMTVPGVGWVTALSFATLIGDPKRFGSEKTVGSYLGLTPRLMQSGMLLRHGRISRQGNKMTRTHLVMGATALLCRASRTDRLRAWALDLKDRVGMRKARVALARKLACVMLSVWKNGRPYEPQPAT